jgi:hypothetical protein
MDKFEDSEMIGKGLNDEMMELSMGKCYILQMGGIVDRVVS